MKNKFNLLRRYIKCTAFDLICDIEENSNNAESKIRYHTLLDVLDKMEELDEKNTKKKSCKCG